MRILFQILGGSMHVQCIFVLNGSILTEVPLDVVAASSGSFYEMEL